jgi:uncharacterized protein
MGKKNISMSLDVAERIIDFIFTRTPHQELLDIGFFGGEPLLEFELIRSITSMIKAHRQYDANRVFLSVVTNGTVFSKEIAEYMIAQGIDYCISCDGSPSVQNLFRRFRNGGKTSAIVEDTIRKAVNIFPTVMVNAVFTPETLTSLAKSVDYFRSLGLRRLFFSPDFSAVWSEKDIEILEREYACIAEKYISRHLRGDPYFINIIDNKITVFLRGGYQASERCRMGTGEFAFAPTGNIYGCERLIGDDNGSEHCIGNIAVGTDINLSKCHFKSGGEINIECLECGIKDYCMNWCGCSNFFSSGYYNRVSTFLCASERAAVNAAYNVFQKLEKEPENHFIEHLAGRPYAKALFK